MSKKKKATAPTQEVKTTGQEAVKVASVTPKVTPTKDSEKIYELEQSLKNHKEYVAIIAEESSQLNTMLQNSYKKNVVLENEIQVLKKIILSFVERWKAKKNIFSKIYASYYLMVELVKWAETIKQNFNSEPK